VPVALRRDRHVRRLSNVSNLNSAAQGRALKLKQLLSKTSLFFPFTVRIMEDVGTKAGDAVQDAGDAVQDTTQNAADTAARYSKILWYQFNNPEGANS